MFDSRSYDIRFVQKEGAAKGMHSPFNFAKIFKFFANDKDGKNRLKYIVRAEMHDYDVYSIKYYAARDRKRDDKYYKLTNGYKAHAVFATCAKIVPLLLEDHPNASFAFNASRSRDETNRSIENIDNNQRFRLYRYVIDHFFGSQTFEHFAFPEVSSYLMVNKRSCENTEARKDQIKESFLEIYNFSDSL